jgi:hypothetical protein
MDKLPRRVVVLPRRQKTQRYKHFSFENVNGKSKAQFLISTGFEFWDKMKMVDLFDEPISLLYNK